VGRWWGKRKRPLGCVIHELNEWVDVAEKGAGGKTKNLGGDIRKMENVCNWVRKKTKLNGNRTTAMSKKILPLVHFRKLKDSPKPKLAVLTRASV